MGDWPGLDPRFTIEGGGRGYVHQEARDHQFGVLEELVKVFLMVLYGFEPLRERSEQKLRKRLARQLVARRVEGVAHGLRVGSSASRSFSHTPQ